MFEMIFIPIPGMGHLVSTVEMAKLLLNRDCRFSVTVIAITLPSDNKTTEYIRSLSTSFDQSNNNIRFIILPHQIPPTPTPTTQDDTNKSPKFIATIDSYKSSVRDAVAGLIRGWETLVSPPTLAGLVIDMFCTTMIDVAKEFGVPCYVFFTSNASFLALHLHLQQLYDQNNSNDAVAELSKSDTDNKLTCPGFANPVPGKVIPYVFFDEDLAVWFYSNARRFRSEITGILFNTVFELESNVINAISNSNTQFPPLYSVGPILNLSESGGCGSRKEDHILKWLDDQPPSSVVFLCFGSMGSFDEDQVKEIATALERSGVRFLWSLRQPPPKGSFEMPKDYADEAKEVLPEGFVERTAGVGRVIGWAPQVEILGHPATGGFVSHCGWNSTLESLWHGVPVATWPMYAEQQLNAFKMVVELELAVEITLDYKTDKFRKEKPRLVSAEEIEKGIRKLMGDDNDEIKKKVKGMSEVCRKSMEPGGSSFVSLARFIQDVLQKAKPSRHDHDHDHDGEPKPEPELSIN